jgi:hypothetical protein
MIATQTVDHVSYEIYGLGPDGARHAIAQGKREYSVDNDIRVEQRTDGTGLVFWVKSLDLFDGFGIGAYVSHEGPLDGFGLFVTHRDWPDGFSWEWFNRHRENEYDKLQGPGRVRVDLRVVRNAEELLAVEFLTDITLRFMDDIRRRQTGERTHLIIVGAGSVFRVAAQQ